MPELLIGLERLSEPAFKKLRGARIGIVMNQASVDSTFRYAYDVLATQGGVHVAAIFAPQHGLWGEEQANMIETPHGHARLPIDAPVYSLYSETRRPSPEMLSGLDALVIDVPDVATRT